MGNCVEKNAVVGKDGIVYGGNVHKITSKEEWDEKMSEANKDGKKVIANFSASWCDSCISIAPFYAELSTTYPSVIFLAVDVDELAEFTSSWEVRTTPTFFFLKDGENLDKHVGSRKPELEKKVAEFIE